MQLRSSWYKAYIYKKNAGYSFRLTFHLDQQVMQIFRQWMITLNVEKDRRLRGNIKDKTTTASLREDYYEEIRLDFAWQF